MVDKHQEILELLPWLVNDTLKDKERLKVVTHLSECSACQLERDRLQELAAIVSADAVEVGNYKPSFEKLMASVDQSESERQRFARVGLDKSGTRNHRAKGQWFVGVAASVLLLVGAVSYSQLQLPGAETLSAPLPTVESTNETQRLSVIFEEGADSATMRAAFVETGAYIVSGPDEEGRYVIEVVPDGEDLLQSLTSVDGVKYVSRLD